MSTASFLRPMPASFQFINVALLALVAVGAFTACGAELGEGEASTDEDLGAVGAKAPRTFALPKKGAHLTVDASPTLKCELLVKAATVLATGASGCSAELGSSDEGATDDDDDGASESSDAVSAAGRWRPSPSAAAVGARVRVPYDGAPPWNPSLCAGGFTAGGKKVKDFLTKKFPEISSIQGYSCRRNTASSGTMSVHGTGRALDIFIPQAGGQADNTKGDKVANYLVEHAEEMNVQFIIWDRSKWRANGTNDSPYGGPNPHIDHLHVEITEEAGRLGPAWYRGATGGGSVDEPVSANPIVRATVDTYIKVSQDDSSSQSDGDKCRVAKGAELALERASTTGEHVSGILKSKHQCGTKFVLGARVFAYRDHFSRW